MSEKKEAPKYAFVTMWLNKAVVPARVFNRVLTKQETQFLNQASVVGETGLPNLAKGQKISSFAETEGKPLSDEEKAKRQKIPLRPRNSQWRGITDIATNLREVGSQVPLVVLTNEEIFMNKTLQAEHPNLQFIWVNETDFLDRHCKIGAGHELHFQKLAIWKLTQFQKVIWIDTDVAFAKNVDYIFSSKKFDLKDGARIYGQIDDYQCDGREWSPTSGGICSAMLLIQPSTLHFQGLMQQQTKMQACWGDQSIIGGYFNSGKRSAHVMDRSVINFARCSKKNGFMEVVHFSGSPNARRVGDIDKRDADGSILNATVVALRVAQEERKVALNLKKKKAQKERDEKKNKGKDIKKANLKQKKNTQFESENAREAATEMARELDKLEAKK